MFNNLERFLSVKKYFSHFVAIFFIGLVGYSQGVNAQAVSSVVINDDKTQISWVGEGGTTWKIPLEKYPYFGDQIPIISIDLETGDEAELAEGGVENCYYRGDFSVPDWKPSNTTHAFINLCDTGPDNDMFTGFVSNNFGVYLIEKDLESGELLMTVDDPTIPLTTPNETNVDNNGGTSKVLKPDTQIPRTGMPGKFPSVEIMVEPSFVATHPDPGYIHRIASTLAFTNFIYEQSGLNPIHLISINLLSGELNANGGQGSVRHKLETLRRGTVQESSGDVSVLMVGGDIDTTFLWGWAIEANACELQIAVEEGDKINTRDVGRSAAFTVDLPSLIQRGWIFAHEFGHVIGASKHIIGDPLMDGWFQYINTVSGYIAGCDATTQLFRSCKYYDPKTKKVTDFYICS